MSKFSTTFTGNTTNYICDVNKKRDLVQWFAFVNAYGTFAGGTITFQVSTDGGTTKVSLMDASGAAITSNANDNFTINIAGGGNNGDAPKIYATMAGAGACNVVVDLFDNNG